MAIEEQQKKEILNMILKKTAMGTFLGLGIGTGLFMLNRKTLSAVAFGYTIGLFLQSANQDLLKRLEPKVSQQI